MEFNWIKFQTRFLHLHLLFLLCCKVFPDLEMKLWSMSISVNLILLWSQNSVRFDRWTIAGRIVKILYNFFLTSPYKMVFSSSRKWLFHYITVVSRWLGRWPVSVNIQQGGLLFYSQIRRKFEAPSCTRSLFVFRGNQPFWTCEGFSQFPGLLHG